MVLQMLLHNTLVLYLTATTHSSGASILVALLAEEPPVVDVASLVGGQAHMIPLSLGHHLQQHSNNGSNHGDNIGSPAFSLSPYSSYGKDV